MEEQKKAPEAAGMVEVEMLSLPTKPRKPRPKKDMAARQPLQWKQLLVIVATAVVVITICSKSSPIYPFNDWVDSNIYLTVGKSMLSGKVPYRDLYDHKGPLLYMLHALAALVSKASFLGVYFLEVAACAAFLFFSFKSMRLLWPSVSVIWIPLVAALVYSATAFCHGDSAEELCLPLLAFALFVGLKSFQTSRALSPAEGFAIGATSACVLWIKFTMLGFYLGWICVPAVVLLRSGNASKLFRLLIRITLGVLAVSAPILVYFAVNHALADLWTVYFYDNLFLFSNMTANTVLVSFIVNLLAGVKSFLYYNRLPAILIGVGTICLARKKEKREFWFYVTSLVGTMFLVYIGGRRSKYYSLIMSAFAPIGMSFLGGFLQFLLKKAGRLNLSRLVCNCFKGAVCVLSAVLAFSLCNNTYLLSYEKEDMPQYKFAEIIHDSAVQNATLLNYGFLDGGFYTAAGIVPTCKYFCKTNVPLEEMMETQQSVVESGGVDFVVTRGTQLESDQYECVANATFYFEGIDFEYFLYQRIP